MNQEEYYIKLSDAIYDMIEEDITPIVEDYLAEGYDAMEAIDHGLIPGMDRVGESFDDGDYFVTDLLFAADTMYLALDILEPVLRQGPPRAHLGKCIIGEVQGDIHDIGKNLVRMMLDIAGFEIIDLGTDVPNQEFIDAAVREDVDIICISSLMSTTMDNMGVIIQGLVDQGLRDRFKVMIGGGPISAKFAQQIGADAYSANATEAVEVAKSLMGV